MITNECESPVIWKKDLDGVRRRWIKRFVLLNAVYWIILGTGISSLLWLTPLFPCVSRVPWMDQVSSRESKVRDLERMVKRFRLKEEIYQILQGNGISLGQGMGIAESILTQCETLQLPPELILSIIKKETNVNPGAVSKKGAMGIMQIMPITWDDYVRKLDLGVSRQAAFDPVVNIRVGAQVVKDLYEAYKQKTSSDQEAWKMTLSAYYSGPQDIAQRGLHSGHVKYVSDVLENQRRYAQRFAREGGSGPAGD
jgi:hypothetical protein